MYLLPCIFVPFIVFGCHYSHALNLNSFAGGGLAYRLRNILADVNYAVACPTIFKLSSHFINSLWIVLRGLTTTSITVTFIFHTFCSLARSWYLSPFSLSFIFSQWSVGTAKFTILQILYCLLTITLVVWPRLGNPLVFQNPKAVCVSHSPG